MGDALAEGSVRELQGKLHGQLLRPGDADYEGTRYIWNGMIDKRPALIARCVDTEDVLRAVDFAREHNLLVAVRSGGHSFPGHSVCDGGLMIDLSPMKGIRVEPSQQRVRAQPGVLWGELDQATQAHSLAVTGGQVSHTGIAGLTLGGGMGWLMRKCGLTVDNLLAVDVVTAEGQLLRANAHENAELFWGLRGGGGNFGIVTAFEYRLHSVGPIVFGGLVAYPFSEATAVLRLYREAVVSAPDELTTTAALLTTPDGHPAVGIALCYAGSLETGEQVVGPLRRLGTAVLDQVGPMPYTAVQSMLDQAAEPGRRYYMRSNLLSELNDEAIETLTDRFARTPSPLSLVILVQMGGAVSRVPRNATAFFHRDAAYSLTALASWIDPAEDESNIEWTRELWGALRPHTPNAVYVNELSDEGEDRVRAAYGPSTYDRLVALKNIYDPTNFFRLNQNITPSR